MKKFFEFRKMRDHYYPPLGGATLCADGVRLVMSDFSQQVLPRQIIIETRDKNPRQKGWKKCKVVRKKYLRIGREVTYILRLTADLIEQEWGRKTFFVRITPV